MPRSLSGSDHSPSSSTTKYADEEREFKRKSSRRDRSASGSPSPRRRHSDRRRSRSRSGSDSHRRSSRRDAPSGSGARPSRVLGVFGMSLYTTEKDLREVFGKYGSVEDVQIIYDRPTQRSRGFGFVYFEDEKDATDAKEACNDLELDGHRIRVDYSRTKKAHSPTPGQYMGNVRGGASYRPAGSSSRDAYRGGYDRDHRRDYDRERTRSSRNGYDSYSRRDNYDRRRRSRSYSGTPPRRRRSHDDY